LRLPYHTDPEDDATAGALRFGLIMLQADEIVEAEFPWLVGAQEGQPRLRLHFGRVPCQREVTPENLTETQAALPAAVDLLPQGVSFDAIAFACTSGATVLGEAQVEAAVHKARPGVAVSNPLSAVKAACRALKLQRIGFVSPYVAGVSAAMREKLATAGIDTFRFGSFEVADDSIVARVTPASILDAVLSLGEAAACDGVFVACTNLRAAAIIEQAEARLGKPVVSSNQALAWHMLRLAGRSDPLPRRGRLFTLPLD
jgi:maleate isomerase